MKFRKAIWGVLLVVGIGLIGAMVIQESSREVVPEQHPIAPVQLKKVSPYEFAAAVIDSLGWAADAREVLVSSETDTLTSMTNMRLAIIKLERAKDTFQPFLESNDKTIQTTLGAFDMAYGQLVLSLNETIRISEQLLAGPDQREYAKLINEQSKWLAQASEGWKALVLAVVGTSQVLVDNSREEGGRLPYLSITAAERAALSKQLEKRFGESVKEGSRGGQHAVEVAPAMLWEFLNQSWKPSDA